MIHPELFLDPECTQPWIGATGPATILFDPKRVEKKRVWLIGEIGLDGPNTVYPRPVRDAIRSIPDWHSACTTTPGYEGVGPRNAADDANWQSYNALGVKILSIDCLGLVNPWAFNSNTADVARAMLQFSEAYPDLPEMVKQAVPDALQSIVRLPPELAIPLQEKMRKRGFNGVGARALNRVSALYLEGYAKISAVRDRGRKIATSARPANPITGLIVPGEAVERITGAMELAEFLENAPITILHHIMEHGFAGVAEIPEGWEERVVAYLRTNPDPSRASEDWIIQIAEDLDIGEMILGDMFDIGEEGE